MHGPHLFIRCIAALCLAAVVGISDREAFVWGGVSAEGWGRSFGDGAILNVDTGLWRPVTTSGAHPSTAVDTAERYSLAHAVWTGREVLVYGGWNPERGYLAEGRLYDPASDSWRTMAAGPEYFVEAATGVMTPFGFALIGGMSTRADGQLNTMNHGFLYDPEANSWARIAPRSASAAMLDFNRQVLVMGGLLYYGGQAIDGDGTKYVLSTLDVTPP